MSIPSGTKFHGVAPGVDTENRGSANANADRDAYAIEEFNGTSFKGFFYGPSTTVTFSDRVASLRYNFGFDDPNCVVFVGGFPNRFYRTNSPTGIGIIKAGSQKGRVIDVVVQGIQNPASVFYAEGTTPEVGDNLYVGQGGFITGGSTGDGLCRGDYLPLGTVTGRNPVKVLDYGYASVWEVEAYYSFPSQSPYYIDGIAYNDSMRQPCRTNYPSMPTADIGTVGDIVKISTAAPYEKRDFHVERVSSSDPVESFVGIVPDSRKSPGSLPTDDVDDTDMVCMSGSLFLPRWVINGADPVRGGLIYVDATTPYKLTTDSTSGIVIGLVEHLTFEFYQGPIERVLIQVKL